MEKLLTYPGKTDKGVFTYLLNEEKGYLEKTAAAYHPTIASYINNVRPIKGETQLLITALGAGEFWGDNVNSDFFGEDQLAHDGEDYGFKTFETMARLYKHHINKPNSQHYGRVILSVYNPAYHRVELIISVDHSLAPDIIEGINEGRYPVYSMGCRIPFDVCSICGNKAPTRKYYCEHLRYQLGQIDPKTGRKVFAINIRPKFFDISIVLIPADKTAMTLKKVAFTTGYTTTAGGIIIGSAEAAELAEKAAADKAAGVKSATMDKEIPANEPPASEELISNPRLRDLLRAVPEIKSREPSMPREALDSMAASAPFGDIMSTMSAHMIMPKPQEFQRIFLISIGQKPLADKLDSMNTCFDPASCEEAPAHFEDILGLSPAKLNPSVSSILEPFMESRSSFGPLMAKRMTIMVKQAEMYPQQYPPMYVNAPVPNHNDKVETMTPLALLGLGAALYAALASKTVGNAVKGLYTLGSKHPIAATAVSLGILASLTAEDKKRDTRFGRFSEEPTPHTDMMNMYERIENMREKPYVKIGTPLPAGTGGAALRRLLIGAAAIPATAHVLQQRHDAMPSQDEGAITGFIRKHPNLSSAAVMADAVLATQGKGTIKLTRHVGDAYRSWLKGDHLAKAANVVMDEGPYPEVRAASGTITGSFLDQAILDLSGMMVANSNRR